MSVRSVCCGLAFVLTGAATASAQVDNVLTYREFVADRQAYRLYLSGAFDAFGWGNASLSRKDWQPLYCAPDDLGLTTYEVEAVLDSYLLGQDNLADMPINMLLLFALQDRWPCA